MSMFASALHLNRKAIRDLRITDLYSIHRIVVDLHEDVRSDEEKKRGVPNNVLFADQGGDARGRRILMLSDRKPTQNLPNADMSVETKEVPESFLSHDTYQFKVTVNPTRRCSSTGKRLAIRGRADIEGWFGERSAASWGFHVRPTSMEIDGIEVQTFSAKNNNTVTLSQAHIRGVLTVSDESSFKKSFKQGIGRGKAFGCGLLQIVPVLENPFS